jgi:hypothetical protein
MTSFRLAAAAALLLSCVALVASAAGAAAAPASPGHTIASAGSLGIGGTASGGGGPIDFWKVRLNGGSRVQFLVNAPTSGNFEFQLYAPDTTDTNFPGALSFSTGLTNFSGKSVIDLQAPYNGTFVLAVCEFGSYSPGSCVRVDSAGADNPMDPYAFTTSYVRNVSTSTAKREVPASPTIAAARKGLGGFEAGGGRDIDFWKLPLTGGDKLQFSVTAPTGGNYQFQLFKPGTTDTNFPDAVAVATEDTNFGGTTVIDLKAPHSGTYILAVCEFGSYSPPSCVSVDSGHGDNPMDPYVFTTKQVGGLESRTSLHLSATNVSYGHEKALKFSVTVKAVYGGSVTGKVSVSDGKATVCTISLTRGSGSCTPTSNTEIKAGKYSITASYAGNRSPSRSGASALTVKA